ncbi:hypothetical protein ABV841_000984 [Escherichia coli]|uniref:hypothetical protein n=1 Tax=Escherichia coli TaxID=562 RepID=UPI00159496CA|nr:hypothetical protein [Escherichia coli]MCN4571310.1 hypothetical protein [Escherichia coli]HAW8308756.1 hypothetical protein [Escherichia coli]HBE6094693.1 hypothetical protein [Escherichia coli]HBP8846697.1 hypothetical protein [Escherichia coli]HCU3293152.1 hypothetical protein [Escherichia coli]
MTSIYKKAIQTPLASRVVNSSIKYRAMAGIPFRPANKAYNGLGMPLHGANRGNNATPFNITRARSR